MRDKVVCMVSGGIDSPVACARVAERFDILPLHFCQYPLTSKENSLLALETLERLEDVVGFESSVILPWAGVLRAIDNRVEEDYRCVVCRRAMLISAEAICEEKGAGAIVTGESLGQKASQTLDNIWATSSGVEYPILRPLLGSDKNEVVEESKGMGLWRERHSGCCLVVPDRPRTRADPERVGDMLEKASISGLIRNSLGSALELGDFREDPEGELLEMSDDFD